MKNNEKNIKLTKRIDLFDGFAILAGYQSNDDMKKYEELRHILHLACMKKYGEGKDIQTIEIPIELMPTIDTISLKKSKK